ncbi:MAG: oxidoreductase [Flavisolibacter sp.]|nr:oxidoreductase [Flavisolibacter sp.]MBD0375409.1 oxidoreductase [Flavisolibacter sp.]
MKEALLFLLSLSLFLYSDAQKHLPIVEVLTSGTETSLRGLSVVNDRILWVSGSNGTVGKSTDGGKTWRWLKVKGFENRDFRDVEAFDATTAVIMAVGEPAVILKTNDGGDSWKVVYVNETKGMFLDAMEFWNEDAGIVLGDPINGKFFIARTFDGGSTWKELPEQYKPKADSGEACFAASGTNIRVLDRDEAIFISGGVRSRAFIRDTTFLLPIVQGKETTGANSIAVMDNHTRKGGNTLIVVGGDFSKPTSDSLNCFYSTNRGKNWQQSKKPPQGYRSCVEYLSKKHVITCGPTGVDYSFDGGRTWTLISSEGFHVCRIAKNGAEIFLAGSKGKIGKVKSGPPTRQ